MKIFLSIILFLVSITMLQACSKNQIMESTSTTQIQKIEETIVKSMTEQENKSTQIEKEDYSKIDKKYDEQIKLQNDQVLLYKSTGETELGIYSKEGQVKIISKDLPSRPYISPDGNKAAYLAPYEWEVLGGVHIYDIVKDKNENVLSQSDLKSKWKVKENWTPKKLLWLDDRYLLMIIQFGYGTVTKGGDLFALDTEEKSLLMLTELDNKEQITELSMTKDFINLEIISFKDDNFTEYTNIKKSVEVESLLKSIKNGSKLEQFY